MVRIYATMIGLYQDEIIFACDSHDNSVITLRPFQLADPRVRFHSPTEIVFDPEVLLLKKEVDGSLRADYSHYYEQNQDY